MHIISVGEVLNIESLVLIRRKHRKRFKVNVTHYAVISHTVVELVSELGVFAEETDKVEVSVTAVIFACML